MGAAVVRGESALPSTALKIDCARRDDSGHVTHVGGPGRDGGRWMAALETVLRAAGREESRYFISRGAQQFGLQVKDGHLVTMVDDGWTVRQLPDCVD